MFQISRAALAGLALSALMAGGAQAATHVLTLTGSVNDISTGSFDVAGVLFETGVLELSGFTPFVLSDGDDVEVTVTVTDGAFVVPTRDVMFFGLNFDGDDMPVTSSSTGEFSFDGGPPVGAGCCTSVIYGQNGGALSFTTLFATAAFGLDSPYEVNRISISYQVNNTAAVPEPASWALMITGFAGAGFMLRRKAEAHAA